MMTDLIKRDPFFRSFLALPRWVDDFDVDYGRGLKIRETEGNITVEAVVAGVPAKEVEVNIEDGVLTIKAEKKEVKENQEESREVSYKYYYTAALSGGAWDKAEAEVEDGVVKITVPKAEAAKARKIAVKTKSK